MLHSASSGALRGYLREHTRGAHERLDASLRIFDLASRDGYAEFLAWQLRARMSVEDWLAAHAPPEILPPDTTPLLVADLAALRVDMFACAEPFHFPAGANPIGIAWAIAGSHLGNRAILSRLRKQGVDFPSHFLQDARMQAFWKELLPLIEIRMEPVEAERAALAARAVFSHFHRALTPEERKLAA